MNAKTILANTSRLSLSDMPISDVCHIAFLSASAASAAREILHRGHAAVTAYAAYLTAKAAEDASKGLLEVEKATTAAYHKARSEGSKGEPIKAAPSSIAYVDFRRQAKTVGSAWTIARNKDVFTCTTREDKPARGTDSAASSATSTTPASSLAADLRTLLKLADDASDAAILDAVRAMLPVVVRPVRTSRKIKHAADQLAA